MKQKLCSAIALAGALACASPAAYPADASGAQQYPEKPIRLISPFPPGGSNDTMARYMGIKLGDRLGEQFVIDNRAGASGVIGTDLAAQATPDGYTLLMASTTFVMVPAVRPVPYDIEKSFDPISMIGGAPNSIVIHPGFAVASLRELVERAKAKPASIFYASSGIAGFNHFGGELFKKLTGVDLVHVPYKGGGPAMIDVMAGQVPMMFSSLTQVLPHVRNGKLKVLAVGADKRSPALPDVPTVAEAGYPGYQVSIWWAIVAPAGVPEPIVERLNREITAVLQEPATRKRFAIDAAETLPGKPAELGKYISEELKKWSGVAKAAGITVK